MDKLSKLEKDNEKLSALVKSLSDQLLSKDEIIKSKDQQIKELRMLEDYYTELLKLHNKKKFGSSSEKQAANQISFIDLFDEAELTKLPISLEPEADKVFEKVPAKRKKKKAARGDFAKDLETEVIEYKLDDNQLVCDECSGELTTMKKETRTEIKIIPAQIKRVEHVTYSYSCRSCDKEGLSGFIKKAPSPKALIHKSLVSPSLMAYILNLKYTLALPLYRQEQEFKRLGINLSRQNLSNWTIKGAGLLKGLYKELKDELLTQELLHADETTLEVLEEPGRKASQKSYMWLYRTSRYSEKPVILFDYKTSRSGDNAKTFLEGWQGTYLHCDGYAGYKKIEDKKLCGCWAHAKRKFHDAWQANKKNEEAKNCEDYISRLFALEKEADKSELTDEARLELRKDKSAKLVDDFYDYLEELSTRTLPRSLLGKAITYAQNQKVYLMTFLEDPRIQLSNNLAEQSIRPFVIGRNNWLFSASPRGADSSALIYSIIQTAIANDLKPYYYLDYIFEEIQLNEDLLIRDLLPWSDRIPEECKK